MLELLKSLAVAVIMVPIVMALMLGLIYGLGEVFNVISKFGHRENASSRSHN
ncbi:MAG: AcrZ family multidrug efflux pump-associated protein [Enterobacterales bacterium endosymbiont of Blomia tropicalis]|uniref:AcrZ family multidrug efflux pump-associated protein n=1 Tax=Mixta mediterraneensis TaxID=2758443 RepID=UPI0025A716E5|nr:AcrZ family multidrug efflux pump-associated protein [Mixta mediterraneensis]MDL4913687.1 AcrZ family multidrug efflux pump-associated protein [Mixta mediterraneensis]